jgi:high-affinity iron transporter
MRILKKVGLVLVFALFACATASAAENARGKELYDQRCASCHGVLGAGDGPVAAALPPDQKPRNLKDPSRKFATDDAKMKELLKKGGMAVGLNPLMPGQADLSDADLTALIAYVNSLKGKFFRDDQCLTT